MWSHAFRPLTRGLPLSAALIPRSPSSLPSHLLRPPPPCSLPPPFLHSEALLTIFSCLIFSSTIPILFYVALADFVLRYWSHKLELLTLSQYPPAVRSTL